jgi:hypothetical protein
MPVRVVGVRERGVWPELIAGLTDANNDLVAFLEDCAVPMPGWPAALAARFRDPEVGGVGGPLLTFADVRTENRFVARGPIARVDRLGLPRSQLQGWTMDRVVEDVDFLPMANMAYRTHLLSDLRRLSVPGNVPNVAMEVLVADAVKSHGFRVVFDSDVRVEHHPEARPQRSHADELAYASDYAYAMTAALRSRPLVARAANTLVGSRAAPGVLTFPACVVRARELIPRWHAARRGRRSAVRDMRRLGGADR